MPYQSQLVSLFEIPAQIFKGIVGIPCEVAAGVFAAGFVESGRGFVRDKIGVLVDEDRVGPWRSFEFFVDESCWKGVFFVDEELFSCKLMRI
jgi:hypothetical protein